MMTQKLQILLIIFLLMAGIYLVNLMRKKKMSFTYGLGWLFIMLLILILTLWPRLLDKLAIAIGIVSPVNMLFFFGFCLAVVVIFAMSMTISHLSERVKTLSQELAILRRDMYDACKKREEQQKH